MRFKNSYAAAVAAAVSAVVFSAAFQPVEASIITIDTFTQPNSAINSGGNGVPTVNADTGFNSGSFGGFTDRSISTTSTQDATQGNRTVVASSNGSGLGTLLLTNDGTGTGNGSGGANFSWAGETPPVDLTGQQYAGFWIETAATSDPSNLFVGYIYVVSNDFDIVGLQSAYYELPGMWAPNAATGILFSDLLANNPLWDPTIVTYIEMGFTNRSPISGNTSYTATANFTAISVPEPTHMVFVAGIGAAVGAWRLRKLRRSRTAAGDAIAG